MFYDLYGVFANYRMIYLIKIINKDINSFKFYTNII
jgi:hypothetical protein